MYIFLILAILIITTTIATGIIKLHKNETYEKDLSKKV